MSKSCRDASQNQVTNTSHVIGLGGTQVPIPAAGCADGTADTLTGIPAVLPIVCNAEDVAGAAAVREALDVFVLQVGSTSLTKATTASSEAISDGSGPPRETGGPQCSDTIDNDGDGVIDAADPGCHSDNDASQRRELQPQRQRRDRQAQRRRHDRLRRRDRRRSAPTTATTTATASSTRRTGAVTPTATRTTPTPTTRRTTARQAAVAAAATAQRNAPTGGQSTDDNAELPFTGTDVVGIALAGLLMLAGGLLLRRREDTHPAL